MWSETAAPRDFNAAYVATPAASAARPLISGSVSKPEVNSRHHCVSRSAISGLMNCKQTVEGGQPFSSRLSSLTKRQFVPSAMILPGADLIMPASRSRRE
jgi:hypothetical protein